MLPRTGVVMLLGAVLGSSLASCSAVRRPALRATPNKPPVETAASPASVWALLINGGGSKQRNYQSHLLHVRQMLAFLAARGVPPEQVTVFSSDGSDPAPDLAVRDLQTNPDFWLIADLAIGRQLAEKIRFENTVIDDVALRPATKQALGEWMSTYRSKLRPGDTLLIYVTDHGAKNREDLDNNRIVLWGQRWSVEEFRRFLSAIPKSVRVVALMSQCFSGSFANIAYDPNNEGRIAGNICGFFSSSAARQAYGCYPENLGKNNVGHSFRFLEALEGGGNLRVAHDEVLVTDRTPDVPNRSSDLALQRMLETHAREDGRSLRVYVDSLLSTQPDVRKAYPRLFGQIDAIARSFGAASPRSLDELLRSSSAIPRMTRQLQSYARRWRSALADLERVNFERFLDAHESWRTRVEIKTIVGLDDTGRRRLAQALPAELMRFTKADSDTAARLRRLHGAAAQSAQAAYRMEVRHAAALRMQELLVRVAARIDLEHNGDGEMRRRQQALAACENLDLGVGVATTNRPSTLPGRGRLPTGQRDFPTLAQDIALLDSIRPGWLGIEFGPASDFVRERYQLGEGAVQVRKVVAGSPAERAGLIPRDVIVGTTEEVFHERNQIREWVMSTPVGHRRTLSVLRGGVPIQVRIQIGAAPL